TRDFAPVYQHGQALFVEGARRLAVLAHVPPHPLLSYKSLRTNLVPAAGASRKFPRKSPAIRNPTTEPARLPGGADRVAASTLARSPRTSETTKRLCGARA